MTNILVIDQDQEHRTFLAELLRVSSYEVHSAATGTEGLAAALTQSFDLVLLDLELPDVAGEYVLSAMLSVRPGGQVIVVSGVANVGRRVAALDAGAIDFIAKPFDNAEFLARIRVRTRAAVSAPAVPEQRALWPDLDSSATKTPRHDFAAITLLGTDPNAGTGATGRRGAASLTREHAAPRARRELDARGVPARDGTPQDRQASTTVLFGRRQEDESNRIHLDNRRRALVVDGVATELSQREFLLMSYLLRRDGQVCTRQELLSDVWGVEFDPGTNIVDVYVRRLRRKVGEHLIETVRNHGYRLCTR